VRAVWLNLHRWVGLTLLAFLMLLGLTGSVLVFHKELDAALNPRWFKVEPRLERASVDAQTAAIEAELPRHRVTYVQFGGEGRSTHVHLSRRPEAPETEPRQIQAFVDPHTGELLGWRDRFAAKVDPPHLMRFLYVLHYDLRLGDGGYLFIGIVGLLWLLDHVAAIVLSFPKLRLWRRSFAVKLDASAHKQVYDGHRAAGLWFVPVLMVVAVSGLSFNLSEPFRAAVGAFSSLSPYPGESRPDLATPPTAPIGFDRAVAVAVAARPDLTTDGVSYDAAKGHYAVQLKGPDDIGTYGETTMLVDGVAGAVLKVQGPADRTAGDTFMAWMFPLHSGEAFGLAGRLLTFAAGLVTAWLAGSGLWLYARRLARRSPTARASSSPRAAAVPAE
jgi:uncharacterized iron-regulated membrane protein